MSEYKQQEVFKSSVGKTVRLIFDERKSPFPHGTRVGIIENISGNSVYLNVNGCLEIYRFEHINVMYQKEGDMK